MPIVAWIRLPNATLPQWHFGSVHMSFVTMFALLTLNDWSSVFYVNYLGCDVFPGSFVSDVPGATILSSVSSLMSVPFQYGDPLDPNRVPDPDPNWNCEQPTAKPGFSVLFFVSFTLIASLVMLSMFIGEFGRVSSALPTDHHCHVRAGTISHAMGASIQQLNLEIQVRCICRSSRCSPS